MGNNIIAIKTKVIKKVIETILFIKMSVNVYQIGHLSNVLSLFNCFAFIFLYKSMTNFDFLFLVTIRSLS